jgi:hypothetical protein
MGIEEPAASAANILASLRGDSIARVLYREIKYDDGVPGYLASDHHSLDYGVELHLGSGRVVSFIWKWPVSYFLGVIEGDLSAEVTGDHAIWDASSAVPWPAIRNRTIQAAHLEWFQDDEADGDFPLTVKLVIEPDASVYVTLGIGEEPDDHLAVLFSDEQARRYGRFVGASGARRPTSRIWTPPSI